MTHRTNRERALVFHTREKRATGTWAADRTRVPPAHPSRLIRLGSARNINLRRMFRR